MNRGAAFAQGFLNDERGISSIEYALLLGLVGAGIVLGPRVSAARSKMNFRTPPTYLAGVVLR